MWPRPARPLCATEPQMRPQQLRTPSRWTILSEKDHDRPWPGVPHQACCFSDHGARRRQAWRKRDLRDSALLDLLTTFAFYLIPFVLVLTLVVFVHEFGHFIVGRWCGVKVDAFSIGFGPELWSRVDRLGTRWRIASIPLGGYVKLPWRRQCRERAGPRSLARDAGEPSAQVTFAAQSVWKRAAIVFAGPFANFVLAIAIFAILFGVYGRTVCCAARRQRRDAGGAGAAAGFHGRRSGADRRRRADRLVFEFAGNRFELGRQETRFRDLARRSSS